MKLNKILYLKNRLLHKQTFDNIFQTETCMDIKVDRTLSDNNLVFTITVSNPHASSFSESDLQIMKLIEQCKKSIEGVSLETSKTKESVINLINTAKEKSFFRILDNLKFAIENEFRPRFDPICQEIYNWIRDHQTGELQEWLFEFDPQRTKYYFDNDMHIDKIKNNQQSEYIDEDEYEDDDDEN